MDLFDYISPVKSFNLAFQIDDNPARISRLNGYLAIGSCFSSGIARYTYRFLIIHFGLFLVIHKDRILANITPPDKTCRVSMPKCVHRWVTNMSYSGHKRKNYLVEQNSVSTPMVFFGFRKPIRKPSAPFLGV